jgi:hypothetical protein
MFARSKQIEQRPQLAAVDQVVQVVLVDVADDAEVEAAAP